MAEIPNHMTRGPKDRTRVDVDQASGCVWWSKDWGVPVAELRAAVSDVGPIVVDLGRDLSK